MKLTKSERETLRLKYGNRCAYCGNSLSKNWHADHIKPVIRNLRDGKPYYEDRDTIENMNPACPQCNIDKHNFDLETWRKIIERTNEVLLANSTFRRALRYNLIERKDKPVVFYFETLGNQNE